jgi:hypothetical protein
MGIAINYRDPSVYGQDAFRTWKNKMYLVICFIFGAVVHVFCNAKFFCTFGAK